MYACRVVPPSCIFAGHLARGRRLAWSSCCVHACNGLITAVLRVTCVCKSCLMCTQVTLLKFVKFQRCTALTACVCARVCVSVCLACAASHQDRWLPDLRSSRGSVAHPAFSIGWFVARRSLWRATGGRSTRPFRSCASSVRRSAGSRVGPCLYACDTHGSLLAHAMHALSPCLLIPAFPRKVVVGLCSVRWAAPWWPPPLSLKVLGPTYMCRDHTGVPVQGTDVSKIQKQ
jgi:hypothetical protein